MPVKTRLVPPTALNSKARTPAARSFVCLARAKWTLLFALSLVAAARVIGATAPVNDLFTQAIVLNGLPASTNGSTVGAAKQPGEPAYFGDSTSFCATHQPVWWRWKALTNGPMTVVITMPGRRPTAAVFAGDSPTNLVQMSHLGWLGSFVRNGTNFYVCEGRFNASSGTTYSIAVDVQGPLSLAWDPSPSPQVTGYRLYYGRDPATYTNRADIGSYPASTGFELARGETYYFALRAFTAENYESDLSNEFPLSLPAASSQTGQRFDLAITVPPAVRIMDLSEGTTFPLRTNIQVQTATDDPDGSINRVELLARSPDGDFVIGVISNASPRFTWTNPPAGQFSVFAKAFDNSGAVAASPEIPIKITPPANDDFAGRVLLTNWPAVATAANIGAATEPGEPLSLGGYPSAHTVWFSWRAETNGSNAVMVTMPQYLPIVAVFTGTSLSNLSEVSYMIASESFATNGTTWHRSQANFYAAANTTYVIAVDAQSRAFANFDLAITGLPQISLVSPSDGNFPLEALVPLMADARDPDGTIDRVEYFFQSTGVPQPLAVVQDLASPYYWSNAPAGRYIISAKVFDQFQASASSGPISITIGRPANDDFAQRIQLDSVLPAQTTGSSLAAGSEPGEPALIPGCLNRSVWWTWTSPTGAICTAIVTMTNYQASVGVFTQIDGELREVGASIFGDAIVSNGEIVFTSEARFEATQGAAYAIAVDSLEQPFVLAVTATPTVRIIIPDGEFPAGSDIILKAEADDADGHIGSVDYFFQSAFSSGSQTGDGTSDGFPTTLHNVNAGSYLLTARVVDNLRATAVSLPVPITVGRPANDLFANRAILSGSPWAATGTNLAGEIEPGEPAVNGHPVFHSVWWRWIVPSNGGTAVRATMRDAIPVVGIFTGSSLTSLVQVSESRLDESDFRDGSYYYTTEARFNAEAGTEYAILIDGGRGGVFDLVGTAAPTIRLLNPAPGLDFAAGTNIALEVETGDPDGTIRQVWYYAVDAYSTQLLGIAENPEFTFTLSNVMEGRYTVEAEASDHTGARTRSEPVFFTVGRPQNDDFADRFALIGTSVMTNLSNVAASREPGEPLHALRPGSHSIWFSWTPTSASNYIFSTEGSTFETLLAIYEGTSLSDLIPVASNVHNGTNNTSRLRLDVAAGHTYQVAVDGMFDQKGRVILAIQPVPPPLNDHFENRILMTGSSPTNSGSNINASAQVGEPGHFGRAANKSAWWSWIAPASGRATIDTTGSSFDTLLAIYTGNTLSSLVEVGSDDDSGFNAGSRVTFETIANRPYQIAVDIANVASGRIALKVDFAPTALSMRLARNSNGAISLQVAGGNQQPVIIEASLDLRIWVPVLTNTITAGILLVDLVETNRTHSFFRAVRAVIPQAMALTTSRSQSNRFTLGLNATPGDVVVMEASTNLLDWLSISTNTVLGWSTSFEHLVDTNASHRFFRALRR